MYSENKNYKLSTANDSLQANAETIKTSNNDEIKCTDAAKTKVKVNE